MNGWHVARHWATGVGVKAVSNLAIGFPLFFKTRRLYKVRVRVRVRAMVRVGLGLGLGVGSGASELLIADCRYAIPGDRVPAAGYTTKF